MKYPFYKYVLAAIDWLSVNGAFILALKLHGDLSIPLSAGTSSVVEREVLFFMAFSLVILFLFQHDNLYRTNVFLTVADQTARILKSIFLGVIGLAILSFFTKSGLIVESRFVFLFFTALSFVFLFFFRVLVFRTAFQYATRSKIYRRRVLIVGAGEPGLLLAANITLKNSFGLEIVGFLDNEKPVGTKAFEGFKVLGHVEEVKSCVERYGVDEIIVSVDNVSHEELIGILDRCRGAGAVVKISSPMYSVIPQRLFTEKYGEVSVIGISQSPSNPISDAYKRVFDFSLGMLGLLVLSPVFLILAVLIKIDSKGPVFFRQMRIGKSGKPFTFYKFRSMYEGSDDEETRKLSTAQFIRNKSGNGNGSTKILDESKVTRIGRFLRRTSIDELPQLVNVVRGEMSLVGPRPCLPYEWESYEDWHKKRLTVTPGCTGVWQVSGRSAVSFEDMVILDLYYIQNASPLLDLQLILKTVPVMIFGKGAR